MKNLTKGQKFIIILSLLWEMFCIVSSSHQRMRGQQYVRIDEFLTLSLPVFLYWSGVWIWGWGYFFLFLRKFRNLIDKYKNIIVFLIIVLIGLNFYHNKMIYDGKMDSYLQSKKTAEENLKELEQYKDPIKFSVDEYDYFKYEEKDLSEYNCGGWYQLKVYLPSKLKGTIKEKELCCMINNILNRYYTYKKELSFYDASNLIKQFKNKYKDYPYSCVYGNALERYNYLQPPKSINFLLTNSLNYW